MHPLIVDVDPPLEPEHNPRESMFPFDQGSKPNRMVSVMTEKTRKVGNRASEQTDMTRVVKPHRSWEDEMKAQKLEE